MLLKYRVMKFDCIVANMPFSKDKWALGFNPGGEAVGDEDKKGKKKVEFKMEAGLDRYHRFDIGVPPSSKGDWAFLLHMIYSMAPNGRVAAVAPHGVLFRGEEKDMREKLVQHDLVECVIGIGKNLFYNSPMEACIVICNTNKPAARRGKVLFINAKNEVTRKNSQSYLEEEHIKKIAGVYADYSAVEGFSAIATTDEIASNESKLSIALYVRHTGGEDAISIDDAIDAWKTSATVVRMEYEKLNQLIKAGDTDGTL